MDTAKHCVDKYMVLFRYCSLGGDTATPGRLHAESEVQEEGAKWVGR